MVLASDYMVEIPKGIIQLRDDRTRKKWIVELDAFFLGAYPITQDIYTELMGTNPSTFKGKKLPVETISWHEAVVFCNVLSLKRGFQPCYSFNEKSDEVLFHHTFNGYRLPSEAEWEYACKTGTTAIRYGELDLIAWYKGNSEQKTQMVGQKAPNSWGLYDMLGNVWEWCTDIYDSETYGVYRIFRGGGWCDEERSVMATNRRRSHPTKFKIDDLGFRIARNKD